MGQMIEGKKDGLGQILYENLNFYVGRFKKGLREGHGMMFYANGELSEGMWKADKR